MSARRSHAEPLPPPALPPGDAPLSFDAVYERYAPYVARVVIRMLGNDHEVDDIVQEVFLMAARGLDTVRSPEAVSGWLATIAMRRVQRKLQRRKLALFFGKRVAVDPDSIIASGASAEERLVVQRIYAALDRVSVRDRLAWSLRHLEGEPLDTVASLCGCSLATAKRRIAAAQSAIDEVLRHA